MTEEKKDKPKKLPPKKTYFDVNVEILSPITVKYRVLAKDVEEAVDLVKKGRVAPKSISRPMIRLDRLKSLVVFLAGTVQKVFAIRK